MNEPQSLFSTMTEVGIAIHAGGDPHRVLRIAKNTAKLGTTLRRTLETLLKQDVGYLTQATDKLLGYR